ncbi:glycosyl hydrolase [Spirochaetia bacterium]|nr:glycosyl hydrolase [Spirochaetia bacterium]
MKNRLNIILGSYNHIPQGTEDKAGEHIYVTRLKPFIQALNQYPKIPAVLHYSGVLLTWLEAQHPELLMVLSDLISRKQVEILGGGFYEPMMPLIPQTDKIGQIEMMTAYIRKKFGKRPRGCWIPEAAWEQQLVGVLHTCDMGYTFLEERHFIAAGLIGGALYAPCISENQGKITTVFPLSTRLRQNLASHEPEVVLEGLLQDFASETGTAAFPVVTVFPETLYTADAGESPETSYRRFFDALSRFSSDLEFTTPGKFYKGISLTQGPLRKAYFPGDLERKFLIDRPESNGLYTKMMFTHTLINQLRGDKARKQNAREELWKAQGYTLFSAGNTGGIHRASLRKAAYKALLGAEKICRNQGKFTPSLLAFDFDLDGYPEYLFQDRNINCYVHRNGASIFELDYLPKTWNYLDTFSDGPRRRTAFADHLVPPGYSLEDARKAADLPAFAGTRFCGTESYCLVDMDRSHGRACFRLPARNNPPTGLYLDAIEMEKQYLLKQDTLSVHYTLINRGAAPAAFKFIPRIDLSFAGDGEEHLKVFRRLFDPRESEPSCREGVEITTIRGIEFRDVKNELTLSLTADRDFDGWIVPIRSGDRYQSTCLMPALALSLAAEGKWETEFKLGISH